MDRTILYLLGAIFVVLALLSFDFPQRSFSNTNQAEEETPSVQSIVTTEAPDAPLPEPIPPEEVPRIEEAVGESTATHLASSTYIAVHDSCGPYFGGDCVNIRSGPSTSTSKVLFARNGMMLPVSERLLHEGRAWYKIEFAEWLRFPERITGPWYIAAEYGNPVSAIADEYLTASSAPIAHKRIMVDRSDQSLTAYDGEAIFMQEKISTGLDLTPTPRGTFTIFKKTPSRYMQGPLSGVSDDYYDLPGVPWNMYFTEQGGAIHGTYWHDHFGQQWSHGCVNLPTDKARRLYEWTPLGTTVIVRD